MADNKQIDPRRPIPSSGYDRLRDNITPRVVGVNPPETRPNVNRGRITTRKDDTVQDVSIGLQDHDEAIMYYFNNVIKPSVIVNGNRTNVPVIYGAPERWKSVQKDGYFRDKEGKLQVPLIMFKRDSVEKRRDLGNKLDGNNPQLHYTFQEKFTKRNQYDNFSVLQNRIPQKEFHAVVVPDFVKLNYTCTIWCDYIAQMNKLIETINFTSDSYWGDSGKFKFNAKIDTFSNTTEIQQGDNRIVKSDFGLVLQGYLVPDSINKELAKKPQKFFSKSTVVFNTEIEITPSFNPKTRDQIRTTSADPNSSNFAEANEAATYGSLNITQNSQQAGLGIGYQTIGSTTNNNIIT